MARESIDWTGKFEEVREGLQPDETLEAFVEHAAGELSALHIPDEIVKTVEAADCSIKGPRYFEKLFSKDDAVSAEDRAASVFTGSVAHGRIDLAAQAYVLLTRRVGVEPANTGLLHRLNEALRSERRSGTYTHISRLDGATQALGKPAYRRFLGNVATELVMRQRY